MDKFLLSACISLVLLSPNCKDKFISFYVDEEQLNSPMLEIAQSIKESIEQQNLKKISSYLKLNSKVSVHDTYSNVIYSYIIKDPEADLKKENGLSLFLFDTNKLRDKIKNGQVISLRDACLRSQARVSYCLLKCQPASFGCLSPHPIPDSDLHYSNGISFKCEANQCYIVSITFQ